MLTTSTTDSTAHNINMTDSQEPMDMHCHTHTALKLCGSTVVLYQPRVTQYLTVPSSIHILYVGSMVVRTAFVDMQLYSVLFWWRWVFSYEDYSLLAFDYMQVSKQCLNTNYPIQSTLSALYCSRVALDEVWQEVRECQIRGMDRRGWPMWVWKLQKQKNW
jgi:hypothetical protein